MFKSIGIGAWGLRHNLKRALEDIKKKNENTAEDDKQSYVEGAPTVEKINPPQEAVLSELFSSFNSTLRNTENTPDESAQNILYGDLENTLDATDANNSEIKCT